MTVASLLHEKRTLPLSSRTGSALALACVLLIFAASQLKESLSGYGTPATILLAVFFYLVCSGATLFGVLTTRSAQRLGSISYSVYLLQGIVLSLIFSVPALEDFAMRAPANYWLVGMLCTCALVATAGLTYCFVELPAIRLGKRVARRPAARAAVTTLPHARSLAALATPSQPAAVSTADP
jgi:peptidoglycan/LPS O-acetylase OafA/YrhL